MEIKIKITKDVLKRSAHCHLGNLNKNCAVAIAMNDLIPDTTVGYENINFERFQSIRQPRDMFQWVCMFDSLSPSERIALPEASFTITLTEEIIEAIGIGQAYKVLSESKTLELVSIQ